MDALCGPPPLSRPLAEPVNDSTVPIPAEELAPRALELCIKAPSWTTWHIIGETCGHLACEWCIFGWYQRRRRLGDAAFCACGEEVKCFVRTQFYGKLTAPRASDEEL